MSVYASTPLGASKKIRVLHLEPASRIEDELRGTLTVAALDDDDASFEALSYTWGGSQENHSIRLNGETRPVTDNLHYALRRLRNRRAERTVWIDALCINQDDSDEKGLQVAMMGEIYSRAARVLVWVGESEKAEPAEPGVRGSVKVKYWKLYRQPNPVLFARQVRHFIDAIRNTTPHWWERAWVVQEAACARRLAVMFGPCEMRWYWFHMLLYGIWEDCIYEDEATKRAVSKADDAVVRIRSIRNRHQKKEEQPITSLLWNARQSQATVAHDKIYSLLAMMPASEAGFLRPDYKEPIEETFAKATCAAIRADATLDILGWIPFRAAPGAGENSSRTGLGDSDVGAQLRIWRNPRLPSWGVDFTNLKYSLFHTPVSTLLENAWEEADTDATYVQYLGGGRLALKGCLLDTIDASVQLEETGSSPSLADEEALCGLLARASTLAAEHDPARLFERGGGGSSREKKDRKKGASASKAWYRRELAKKREKDHQADYLAHGLILWEETADFPAAFPAGYEHSWGLALGRHDWYGHLEAYGRAAAGKAEMFCTGMGLVGVAPGGIRGGDTVALLDGARLPVVLSPREDGNEGEFAFRGYAYVHGSMRRGYQNWRLRGLEGDERRRRRRKFTLR
ncbi:heterokaryon incompatibility protein-domain-containing protein [Durotheca rogersii]|uniref:heterokaryon incompatibility protein-domain-containing protein n=1 Tax=Durotheca rogersii TaxID=419775 RepID=UPI002220759D|nr:heterokaryon incompatibility protein-domain-containing protein [Durotheca rogersii]KAI5867932.1 heterokaryon incompatibility protein-domain-containing protein [Durotheca rogersii]